MLDISPYSDRIQEVIKATAGILNLSVTVVNRNLLRIAGTGIYQTRIGESLPTDCAFSHALNQKTDCVITDVSNDSICRACTTHRDCAEKAEVCTPILFEREAVGVIGLLAEDHSQSSILTSKTEQALSFLKEIALLIARDIHSKLLLEQLDYEKRKLEATLDNIAEGVITLEPDGAIIGYNKRFAEFFPAVKIWPEKHFQEHFPVFKELVSDLFSGKSVGRQLSIESDQQDQQYLFFPSPVYGAERIESLIFTVHPLKTIHQVVNKVLASDDLLRMPMFIGSSKKSLELKRIIKKAAQSASTVLVTGQSGTGKELCARILHNESTRRGCAFIAVNCAALPEALIESELFGYTEGAFTGAKRGGKPGLFEIADKGTIFLDEIGDIPLHIQVKLLRVIQERESLRVGGIRAKKIDVRIIAATNQDLPELVKKRQFREDLYYRLNVIPIHLPPLKDRQEDILLLAHSFVERFNKAIGKDIEKISPKLLNALLNYSWPGNVRELENVIEFGVNFSDGQVLEYETVSSRLSDWDNPGQYSFIDADKAELKPVEVVERHMLKQLMSERREKSTGMAEIAKKLGVSRATVYRKISRYNLTLR